MKSCDNYKDIISSYFDDLLDEDERQNLMNHIKTCAGCESDFLVYEQIFSELDNIPDVPLPDDFHDDFMNRLKKEVKHEVKKDKKILFIGFKRFSFIAASIVAFLFISSFGNQINNSTDFALTKEDSLYGSGGTTAPKIMQNIQDESSSMIAVPKKFVLYGSGSTNTDTNYISSYNITIETSQIESLIDYINNYEGITVSSSVQYGDFNNYSNISKQVPLNDVDNFLATLKSYGSVISESENKQKIQEDLIELQAKKDNESNRKVKLFNYLTQANNVTQITLLEDKINNTQATFNNYDSQINTIIENANFPVVNITVKSANATVIQKISFTTKLAEAFKRSLSNTIYVVSNFIVLIANNIVSLIIVFIIVLIVYAKRRKTHVKK